MSATTAAVVAEQVIAALSAITCPVQRAAVTREVRRNLRSGFADLIAVSLREARADGADVVDAAAQIGVTPQWIYQVTGGRTARSDPARVNSGAHRVQTATRPPATATPGAAA